MIKEFLIWDKNANRYRSILIVGTKKTGLKVWETSPNLPKPGDPIMNEVLRVVNDEIWPSKPKSRHISSRGSVRL